MYRRTADIGVYRAARPIPSVNDMQNHTIINHADSNRPDTNRPPTSHPDTTSTDPRRDTVSGAGRTPRGRHRLVVVAGTAVSALLLWLVAGPVLGINLEVLQTPGATTAVPVTAGSVILSSVAAGLLGWALLAGLERLTTRGATIWRWVAGAVALLSLGGPLTLAQSGGGAVVLTLLHLVVAGVLLTALPGTVSRGAVNTPAQAGRAGATDVAA